MEKAYEKAILDLGGVQVNNVSVPKEEIDRIGKENLMSATYGNSIDFNGLDRIKLMLSVPIVKKYGFSFLC